MRHPQIKTLISCATFLCAVLFVSSASAQIQIDVQHFYLRESVDECAVAASRALRSLRQVQSVSPSDHSSANALSAGDYFPSEVRIIDANAGSMTVRAGCVRLPGGMSLMTITVAGTDALLSGLPGDIAFAIDQAIADGRRADTPTRSTEGHCDIAGTFVTGPEGMMTISRQGDRITASYENGQGTATGRIVETARSTLVRGTFSNSRYDSQGDFEWRFSADGSSFEGSWTNRPGGDSGTWNGRCAS